MNLVDSTSLIKCLQFTILSVFIVIVHIIFIRRHSGLSHDCGHTLDEGSRVSPLMLDSVGLAMGISRGNNLDM